MSETLITKTIVSIQGNSENSELMGNWEADAVKEQFATFFPYITNCTSTVKIEGGVKTITFAERLGTKG